MSIKDILFRKKTECIEEEFCPRCNASLPLQKGYSNELPYWICKGCGEMLISPKAEAEDDIAWICDGCGAMLNTQEGFAENYAKAPNVVSAKNSNSTKNTVGAQNPSSIQWHRIPSTMWKCTDCGYENKIDATELYLTEDEYQASLQNPYKGLTDSEVLELSTYDEIESIANHDNIILVQRDEPDDEHQEDKRTGTHNNLYIKKHLTTYDVDVYRYLKDHPIANMPRIYGMYEGDNNLVVIEEYIAGRTLQDILREGAIPPEKAVYIARRIAYILKELHNLEKPIIHRDIKPSNIIITPEGNAYLIDINVARWYKEEATEDTKLMGTMYYAAPEQFGYGFSASSAKTDIYAVGMLLNVMITGKLPKEEKAAGAVWPIIERCISLEPEERYTDNELISALDSILR